MVVLQIKTSTAYSSTFVLIESVLGHPEEFYQRAWVCYLVCILELNWTSVGFMIVKLYALCLLHITIALGKLQLRPTVQI